MKKLKVDGKKYTFELGIRRSGKFEVFEYTKKYEETERYWGRKDLRNELAKASPFVRRYSRYILNDIYPKTKTITPKTKLPSFVKFLSIEEIETVGEILLGISVSKPERYADCTDVDDLVMTMRGRAFVVHDSNIETAKEKLAEMRGKKKSVGTEYKEQTIEEKIKSGVGVGIGEVAYLMPKTESKIILSSLKRGKNVLLVGPSGCGKSKMVLELAKQEGKDVSRLPLNGGITDASFIGEKGLRVNEATGQTETFFQYGILPTAMREGHWLLLDELDFCQPEYLATLQAVFEGNKTPLTLSDNGGEKIYPHENFRIIATANTLGRGDTNGYHGTNMLNIATLDRWTILTMDYTPQENELLAKIVHKDVANKMVAVAKRIRKAISTGELPDYVFSTRRLLHWAEAVVDLGFELGTQAEVLGRLLAEEKKIIGEFVYDTFGVRV